MRSAIPAVAHTPVTLRACVLRHDPDVCTIDLKMADTLNHNVLSCKEFASVDEATEFVTRYCSENFHPVRHYSRTTVSQFNNKVKAEECRITELPGSQVYAVRWVCKHVGEEQNVATDSSNKRRNRLQLKKGCKFFIYVAYDRSVQKYRVKNSSLEHNHDIGQSAYSMYPSNR